MPDNPDIVSSPSSVGEAVSGGFAGGTPLVRVFIHPFCGGPTLAACDGTPTADMMTISVDDGYGLKPVTILLPGQLHEDAVLRILRDHPRTREIVCIPGRSEEYTTVWRASRTAPQPAPTEHQVSAEEPGVHP